MDKKSTSIKRKKRENQQIFDSGVIPFINTFPDCIVIVSLDGFVQHANNKMLKLYGYENEDQVVGTSFFRFIDISEHEKTNNIIKEMLKGNYTGVVEFISIKKDGTPLSIEANAEVLNDKQGIINAIIVVIRDITDRKNTELKLIQSEEEYRLLFENATETIVVVQDGVIKLCNPMAEKISGYTKEELINKPFIDLIHPDDRQIISEYRIKRLNGDEINVKYDYRVLSKDNTVKWVDINTIKIEWDKRPATLSFLTDITERKLVEETLKSSEEKYRLITEYATDVIWILNVATLKYKYISPAILNLRGYTYDEIKDETLEDALTPGSYVYIKNEIEKNMKEFIKNHNNPQYYIYEIQQPVKNGGTIWVEVSAKPRFNSEGEIELVGVTRNIAERKKAEMELLAAKEQAETNSYNKGEYIANMSHELRTPLNVMYGLIQLFETYTKHDLNKKKLKISNQVKTMKQNCLRLIRLVNNLIDTTKVDTGHFELTLQNNDIVHIIRGITLSVYEYVILKNIELVFNTNVDRQIIACDADIIERIMLNLISNAIKFTESNGVININIAVSEDRVSIAVIDNGIGIPQDKQEMVFERYKQVEGVLARKHEGSGIGLALTKSLIELHGGKIYLKSEPGKGSEFIVELPKKTIQEGYLEKKISYEADITNIIEKMNVEFSDIYK